MTIDWSQFAEAIHDVDRIVLTSHVRPDCDALGSEIGMTRVLEQLGKEVAIVNSDPVPPHLAFIDPGQEIRVLGADISAGEVAAFDAVIVLDTSAWQQLGTMAEVLRGFDGVRIVIDHHVSEDDLKAVAFKDSTAEATGRLVLEAADALNVKLTGEIARPLLAAIATDTGWFRFPSVSQSTFEAVGRLVAANARPEVLYADLYERNTPARLKLRGRILSNFKSANDDQVMYAVVTQRDFAECKAALSDTEEVVNMLLAVEGVRCALLITELDSNTTKVSLRGRSGTDVRAVAETLGGGGHTAAAGATLSQDVATATTTILDAVSKAMG